MAKRIDREGGKTGVNKTGIEYLDYCWNFQTGCRHTLEVCPIADKCWAKSLSHRFGRSFEPTLHPEKLLEPLSLKTPAKIGVCFTGDLMGEWVDPNQSVLVYFKPVIAGRRTISEFDGSLKSGVIDVMKLCPQHQFFFLTKNPAGYQKWGEWPDNAWLGVTACYAAPLGIALMELSEVDCKHKWISLEPLMGEMKIGGNLKNSGIEWVVIGGWSGGKNPPKLEWVDEIITAAKTAGVKVFLKNNLLPLMGEKMLKIQEVP